MGNIRIMDEEIHDLLKAQAAAEDRSDANMLLVILKRYFNVPNTDHTEKLKKINPAIGTADKVYQKVVQKDPVMEYVVEPPIQPKEQKVDLDAARAFGIPTDEPELLEKVDGLIKKKDYKVCKHGSVSGFCKKGCK